jgi:hypothetical protein
MHGQLCVGAWVFLLVCVFACPPGADASVLVTIVSNTNGSMVANFTLAGPLITKFGGRTSFRKSHTALPRKAFLLASRCGVFPLATSSIYSLVFYWSPPLLSKFSLRLAKLRLCVPANIITSNALFVSSSVFALFGQTGSDKRHSKIQFRRYVLYRIWMEVRHLKVLPICPMPFGKCG